AATELAWTSGTGALFAGAAGLLATAGALSLKRASERVAIDENRRQQAFRRAWRPLRLVLAPSAALAIVAILCVLTVAASFNLKAALTPAELIFLIVVSFAGGILFLSARAGLLLFLALVSGAFLSAWARQASGAAKLPQIDFVAATALAAALYAQLALAWRNARSPRLNARETTEAAMSDGAPAFVFSAFLGVAAFFAADAAGVWPSGARAALTFAALALYGLLIAPAIMTALSHSVRRELA
ncbi:MAG TPA: hypothetical protein VNH64_06950, partial [Parvularculaceae bacterium]|nr:hypothetical protein [Parvularculaceae bacterium]